ncbi:MAG: hypothetical protein M3494_03840 [Actinomycetota bacterium]|jgi:hypothetical protein|nr:hypothetical protein [Rubrobacter sp.]MDQ3507136.1 hypothetical protein [Actinomycetota bacterium]
MKRHDFDKEEVVRRGREIYEREIRAKVEPEHEGRFLAVDITDGSYEVGESDVEVSGAALGKNPKAVLYLMRVGHPAAYRLGAGLRR